MDNKIKKIILRIFLISEIFIFGYFHIYGTHGWKVLQLYKKQNDDLLQKIHYFEKEISKLEDQLYDWETNSFYKEKIAREQLQMARDNEEIYYFL